MNDAYHEEQQQHGEFVFKLNVSFVAVYMLSNECRSPGFSFADNGLGCLSAVFELKINFLKTGFNTIHKKSKCVPVHIEKLTLRKV
jgi:hypothetical protein